MKMKRHLIVATFNMVHSTKDFMGTKLEKEGRPIRLPLRTLGLAPIEICMWDTSKGQYMDALGALR
jgi:hypothetical protein